MKRKLLFFATILSFAIVSCKKDKDTVQPAPVPIPTPIPTPVPLPVLDDTARAFLKDVVMTNLPSPYYHFEYDNAKYVTKLSFASNLEMYDLQYENKRLKKMRNTRNDNELFYTYSNDKVSAITELSGITGQKTWEYFFDYNTIHQLIQIRWLRVENNVSKPYRKVMLTYYPDGNLATTDDFMADANDVLVWDKRTEYKNYDNTVNVSDFSLFKNFFETLLYLPAVSLQKNNPAIEIVTGAQNDFKITYTYQYNNGLPTRKAGTMIQTRGTGNGQPFNFSINYSYY